MSAKPAKTAKKSKSKAKKKLATARKKSAPAKKKTARKTAGKKKTARKAASKKTARKKTTKKAPKRTTPVAVVTTEIVFSYAEIDFLRKITGRDLDQTAPKERRARLSLRDKLLDINFNVPTASGGLIVLDLDRNEVGFLRRITKEGYSFITAEERRARLILREKILIGVEKITGRPLNR